jgi:hypothetical protein
MVIISRAICRRPKYGLFRIFLLAMWGEFTHATTMTEIAVRAGALSHCPFVAPLPFRDDLTGLSLETFANAIADGRRWEHSDTTCNLPPITYIKVLSADGSKSARHSGRDMCSCSMPISSVTPSCGGCGACGRAVSGSYRSIRPRASTCSHFGLKSFMNLSCVTVSALLRVSAARL